MGRWGGGRGTPGGGGGDRPWATPTAGLAASTSHHGFMEGREPFGQDDRQSRAEQQPRARRIDHAQLAAASPGGGQQGQHAAGQRPHKHDPAGQQQLPHGAPRLLRQHGHNQGRAKKDGLGAVRRTFRGCPAARSHRPQAYLVMSHGSCHYGGRA